MKKEIIIEIDLSGNITIEAIGYKGPACEKATKAFEAAAGMVKSKKKKPEYFMSGTTTNTTAQGVG